MTDEPPPDVVNRFGLLLTTLLHCAAASPGLATGQPLPDDVPGTGDLASRHANEAGHYFVQNFAPRNYGHHSLSWAITQDASGVLYVGNTDGVLTFDGVRWGFIPLANRGVARSMDVGADGRIYVGGHAEIGYLQADSSGVLRYISLLDRLPAADRAIADVWQTFALPDGVYFMAPQQLMRWSETRGMEVWPADPTFHVAFAVRDTVYVRQREIGLLRLTDAGLRSMPGGEAFADDDLYVLLPFGQTGLLAVSRRAGVTVYENGAFRPLTTTAGRFLRENQIYHGALLADGTYALGTLRGGVAVIDSTGRFLRVLDESVGLRDQSIKFTYVDQGGGMWLALNDGLARIEMATPVTVFDEAAGLDGGARDVVRHRGRIFATTSFGVVSLVPADGRGSAASFVPVPGIRETCWSLLSTDEGLLAGCEGQSYLIMESGVRVLRRGAASYSLRRSRFDADLVYEGLTSGLSLFRRAAGGWTFAGLVPGVVEQVYSIQEDETGALWLGTNHEGVLRLTGVAEQGARIRVERFGMAHGLPEHWVNVFRLGARTLFGTEAGLLRFDGVSRFVPDTSLGTAFADGTRGVFMLAESLDGATYLDSAPEVVRVRSSVHGPARVEPTPLRRLPESTANALYPEPDGTLWIARNDGLFRYDASVSRPPYPSPPALIRSVTGLETGNLLRGGGAVATTLLPIPFDRSSLRFEYAAPLFDGLNATRYQTRLDGLDERWSAWTSDTYREFTRLDAGAYVFRVRARDAFGTVTTEATLAVTVLPPWYDAWWARLFYLLMGVGFVFGLVRWRSHRLEEQKRHLQQLVRERTLEIEQQRTQLAEQAQKLLEMDEMKSRFFANVSHEFRTPLTLTIGPLHDLSSGLCGQMESDVAEQVDLALRNSQRLLRLINQLLDVAKIESGRMTLDARPGDLTAFLGDVASAFVGLAERKGIAYAVDVPEHPMWVRFDPDQLEKVFGNLLSNAFKFTPPQGRIRLGVSEEMALDGPRARIDVADTGPGIPADDLPHVFDRFYQSEAGRGRAPSGTGIGLALARELVGLHEGHIEVESEPGVGSTFIVHLPLLAAPPEIVPTADPSPEITRREPAVYVVREPVERPGARLAVSSGEPRANEPTIQRADEPPPAGDDVTTVMVVDDNPDIRAYIRRHLARAYRVVEHEDGAAALAALPDTLPDLIISDVMMPGMDGFAFCAAVRANPAHDFIPVILLTARADRSDRLDGWEGGADDYVTKPFDMEELEARVRNLIASRQRLRNRLTPTKRTLAASDREVVSAEDVYLDRVRAAVEERLSDEDLSVDQLAEAVGQSRVQLYRRLQSAVGKSPSDVIREIRLGHARQLLAGRAGTVSEVAYGVGFKSVSHFCRCFKDAEGLTPAQYMAAARAEGEGLPGNDDSV